MDLKYLLRQGLSEPEFYGDLVYKLKKIVGSNNFSAQFIKIISHYKTIGYNISVSQQTAIFVVNQITVGNFAFLLNCTPMGRFSDSFTVRLKDLSLDEMVVVWHFGRGLPVRYNDPNVITLREWYIYNKWTWVNRINVK